MRVGLHPPQTDLSVGVLLLEDGTIRMVDRQLGQVGTASQVDAAVAHGNPLQRAIVDHRPDKGASHALDGVPLLGERQDMRVCRL